MEIAQGGEMGGPSRRVVTAGVRDGALSEVRVEGSAVPLAEGRIAPPPA
ncbi:hypothetical protein [Pararhodobacter sp.]